MTNPRSNKILGAIPEKEFEYLAENLKLVSLTKHQTLFDINQIPLHVYFPVGAIISMLRDMPDGSCIETHMLGKSGMVGTGVGASGIGSFYRARVRSCGLAYKMDIHSLRMVWSRCPGFAQTAQESIQQILGQLIQSIICSKKHSIDQQLVRWILLTLDNSFTSTIDITHQELSGLLGFRREAISLAMRKLSENGLIAASRGAFTVQDRTHLEMAACDCYWIAQQKIRPIGHISSGTGCFC